MEEVMELHRKFKSFLSDFLIRRLEKNLTADDFQEDKYEYMRTHLPTILPNLSLVNAKRLRIYFNDLLIFHIKERMEDSVESVDQSAPPTSRMDEAEQNSGLICLPSTSRIDQPSQRMLLTSRIDISQQTPLEPVIHSTPLSVPIVLEDVNSRLLYHQQRERSIKDDFILEIISQINPSPIPREREINRANNATEYPASEINETPLMRAVPRKKRKLNNSSQSKVPFATETMQDRSQMRIFSKPKKKKSICFAELCSLEQTRKTDKEKTEESFLYFAKIPGKIRNILNLVINKDKDLAFQIPMERISNLSNIIRAYVSQREPSVDYPRYLSKSSIVRSPRTPQTSHPYLLTPPQADASGSAYISDNNPFQHDVNILSAPTTTLLRQPQLLTIPERDSSINIINPPENEATNQNDIIGDIISIDNIQREASINEMNETILQPQPDAIADIPLEDVSLHITDPQVEIISQRSVAPTVNWFEVLRNRPDIVYPEVSGERRKKRKKRKKTLANSEQNPLIYELPEIPMSPGHNIAQDFQVFPNGVSEQTPQITHIQSDLVSFVNLIKEAGKSPKYRTWQHFDPGLFSENDDLEMYTYIFKRSIKEGFLVMDTLFEAGISRLKAAKGFRLILELKAMDLIEIEAVETRIIGFTFKHVVESDL